MKQGLVSLLYNLGKVHRVDITHDNVCSSMLSCFYLHLLSTGRPISSFSLKQRKNAFYCATIVYHVELNAILGGCRHWPISIKNRCLALADASTGR